VVGEVPAVRARRRVHGGEAVSGFAWGEGGRCRVPPDLTPTTCQQVTGVLISVFVVAPWRHRRGCFLRAGCQGLWPHDTAVRTLQFYQSHKSPRLGPIRSILFLSPKDDRQLILRYFFSLCAITPLHSLFLLVLTLAEATVR